VENTSTSVLKMENPMREKQKQKENGLKNKKVVDYKI